MNRKRIKHSLAALCVSACAAVWMSSTSSEAQTARENVQPFPDFSAKRQKPPKAGTRKRITVQITPEGPRVATVVPNASGASAGLSSASSYPWFWSAVPPSLDESSPANLSLALTALANPPTGEAIPAPRLQLLASIAQTHGVDILTTTVGKQVSPALVVAVIAIESAGRADAVSSAGAEGLMQLMPGTASRFGVSDSFASSQNIKGGVSYLDWLMSEFDSDPVMALAAYNAGEGAVRDHNGVPPFEETRGYVPKVLAAFQVAKGLCLTPPELASDGCVFRDLGG